MARAENGNGVDTDIEELVLRHVPDAVAVSHAGDELSFQLPHSFAPVFPALLREIKVCAFQTITVLQVPATKLVLLCYPERRFGHPENYSFESHMSILMGSNHPKQT